MSKKGVIAVRAAEEERAHWVIDGVAFVSCGNVYGEAVKRGFTGSYQRISSRLLDGDNTWESLLRPVKKAVSDAATRREKRKHDEMSDVIAALDARKKAMAEGGEG